MSLFETLTRFETKFKVQVALLIVLSGFFLSANARAQNSVTFFPKDSSKNALTIYVLKFSLEKALPSDAAFRFLFSDGFDLSHVEIAGSSTINGGFEIEVKGQEVLISRTGLGDEIPAKKKAALKFALVINPDKAQENYPLDIEFLGGDAGVLYKTRVNIAIK